MEPNPKNYRRQPRQWTADYDLDELWVCACCDAHLHVDSVGDTCPVCGVEINLGE